MTPLGCIISRPRVARPGMLRLPPTSPLSQWRHFCPAVHTTRPSSPLPHATSPSVGPHTLHCSSTPGHPHPDMFPHLLAQAEWAPVVLLSPPRSQTLSRAHLEISQAGMGKRGLAREISVHQFEVVFSPPSTSILGRLRSKEVIESMPLPLRLLSASRELTHSLPCTKAHQPVACWELHPEKLTL